MSKHNNQDEGFDALLKEITAAEAGLRGCFTDTPLPAPEAMARIKSRLQLEMRPRGRAWPLWASAIAAAILLAIGAGLYYQSQPDRMAVESAAGSLQPTADAGNASLETFTASLPTVLSDEDPAMQQLSSDLKELESQTSTVWSNG